MQKILIIEDDLSIAEIERDYLVSSGFDVTICTDGIAGQNEATNGCYNLILLDIMLPGKDGFDICNALRTGLDIPILFVTAKITDNDKIRGLGLGADDYIEKPFSPKVLVARVKANLAQYGRIKQGYSGSAAVIRQGGLTINTETHEVTVDGNIIELKNREYELLLFLIRNKGIVFSRDALYDRIWGIDAIGDSTTVAVHINRLREKLNDDSSTPRFIQTLRGAGYRFIKNTEGKTSV